MWKISLLYFFLCIWSVSGYTRISYEPVNLSSNVNTRNYEGSPDISADGKSLYFDVLKVDGSGGWGNWDIWAAHTRTPYSNWTIATPLPEPVNSQYSDAGPSISNDGLTLYFASNRPGGYGSFDIYMTTRKTRNDPWEEPENLGPSVNSSSEDNHPSISVDGLSLYFDSTRSNLSFLSGGRDIYVVKRAALEDEWGLSRWRFITIPSGFVPIPIVVKYREKHGAENLGPAVNTHRTEFAPDISSDELTLYYDSTTTDRDIWVAKRATKDSEWEKGIRLDEPFNTTFIDSDPSISAENSILFFMSARSEGKGLFDIWRINIRKE